MLFPKQGFSTKSLFFQTKNLFLEKDFVLKKSFYDNKLVNLGQFLN